MMLIDAFREMIEKSKDEVSEMTYETSIDCLGDLDDMYKTPFWHGAYLKHFAKKQLAKK